MDRAGLKFQHRTVAIEPCLRHTRSIQTGSWPAVGGAQCGVSRVKHEDGTLWHLSELLGQRSSPVRCCAATMWELDGVDVSVAPVRMAPAAESRLNSAEEAGGEGCWSHGQCDGDGDGDDDDDGRRGCWK